MVVCGVQRSRRSKMDSSDIHARRPDRQECSIQPALVVLSTCSLKEKTQQPGVRTIRVRTSVVSPCGVRRATWSVV